MTDYNQNFLNTQRSAGYHVLFASIMAVMGRIF